MKMLLRAAFPNGLFGDPALHVWDINGRNAFLFDCGELSRLSIRQMLKVSTIFLSHCHMDHIFGFDLFLRAHMGAEKSVRIFGPPDTTSRIAGKLRGYTWNLIHDQLLEFVVSDLDPVRGTMHTTHFHSRDAFCPTNTRTEDWDPANAVYDAHLYRVRAATLDHRTPSMAYAIEEKPAVAIDILRMRKMGLKPGPWISELKHLYLFGGLEAAILSVPCEDGSRAGFNGLELSHAILSPKQRHKLAYVTDGAASPENRRALLPLIEDADILFSETCFLEADRDLADETKHFTAAFVGELAREASVKRIAPFHLSKRYLDRAEDVLSEVSEAFGGEVLTLPSLERWSTEWIAPVSMSKGA